MSPALAPSVQPVASRRASDLVFGLVEELRRRSERLQMLEARLLDVVGSPFLPFVDHVGVPAAKLHDAELLALGFERAAAHPIDAEVYRHPALALPAIYRLSAGRPRLALRVGDLADFLVACGRWTEEVRIEGDPFGGLRRARLTEHDGHEVWAVERQGIRGFTPRAMNSRELAAAMRTREGFRRRPRYVSASDDATEVERLGRCASLIQHARAEFGVARVASLFFDAEIERFVRRNRAGRVLESRLRVLGVGFPHLDHLVYRSSRARLRHLMRIFETLGFERRAQLATDHYGAQVLDHPELGFSVIAEVDLAPGERATDFAYEALPPLHEPGPIERSTVLHGESILGAGPHRLAVEVDLDRARAILATERIEVLAPELSGASQESATAPEPWLPDVDRVDEAVRRGVIDGTRSVEIMSLGAPGSELGLVERFDGRRDFDAERLERATQRSEAWRKRQVVA